MPKCTCVCGATYRVPDAALGRRVRCKKCGSLFEVEGDETGPIPVADFPSQSPSTGEAIGVSSAAVAPGASGDDGVEVWRAGDAPTDGPISRPTPARGYGQSILWTLLFPSDPRGLLTLAGIVAMFVLVDVTSVLSLGLLTSIAWFLFTGAYCGFRFSVVEGAAAGDESLPDVRGADFIDDILKPAMAWVGACAAAGLPAVMWLMLQVYTGVITAGDGASLSQVVFADPRVAFAADPIFCAMIAIGVILFPMIVLCVSLGGFSCLWRVDLIVLTILRTPAPYLVTLAFILATWVVEVLLEVVFSPTGTGVTTGGALLASALVQRAIVLTLCIYMDIVGLRLIGLYYHHFKHLFAWNWG